MKTYDFDAVVDRQGTDSLKWDIKDSQLPMWVADMDFQSPPAVRQAIIRKAQMGVYGYSIVPDKWYQAYISWWLQRHEFKIEADWLIFSTGVIPSLSSIVRRLTAVGENVLIQPPVYNIFYNSILNNGRHVLENNLVYENGLYRIDYNDLEEKLKRSETTLMILCNPHNPVGKIWSRTDLEHIGQLCHKYHVTVVSDEIHCDLTVPGKNYQPFAQVSSLCRDISVTLVAPSKTFNMAGLQSSAIICPNLFLRQRVNRGLNNDECAEPNVFAVDAAVAAFTECGDWLDELREYLYESRVMTADFLKHNIPSIHLVDGDATYLLWLDCRSITMDTRKLASFLRLQAKLWLSSGEDYGNAGSGFLRLNVACPHSVLSEGLSRLAKGIEMFLQASKSANS